MPIQTDENKWKWTRLSEQSWKSKLFTTLFYSRTK
jgi:hypothetical protein